MDVRLKLAELMRREGSPAPTARQLAKRVAELQHGRHKPNRVSERSVYRLVANKGEMEYYDARMIDVLTQVFRVEDANDLIELPPLRNAG